MSASTVANHLISLSQKHGDALTHLKLQKLLYYAEGWHLALFDRSLFDDPIEAWIHGPVVPSVWRRFKDSTYQPLPKPTRVEPNTPHQLHFYTELMRVYGGFSAWQLEQMTHTEPPWIAARDNTPSDKPCNNVITRESMRQHFKALLALGKKQ